jgi:hypothetical protein
MHRISGRIIRPFLISGTRPDSGFDLLDIWPDVGYTELKIAGYHAN